MKRVLIYCIGSNETNKYIEDMVEETLGDLFKKYILQEISNQNPTAKSNKKVPTGTKFKQIQ